MTESIVVVGSRGFVGNHLVRHLMETGFKVFEVHRDSSVAAKPNYLSPPEATVAFTFDEIRSKLKRTEVRAVVNVAQHRGFKSFPDEAALTIDSNVKLVAELGKWCHELGNAKYIHFSSGGVYDRFAGAPLKEMSGKAKLTDLDYYLTTKMMGELVVDHLKSVLPDASIIRPFFVFGPGMGSDRLVGRLAATIRDGLPVSLSDCDGPRLNPCHIDDIVELTHKLIVSDSPLVSNAAGSSILTVRSLAQSIAHELGMEVEFVPSGHREPDCVGDVTLMSEILGRLPRGILDSGILRDVLKS